MLFVGSNHTDPRYYSCKSNNQLSHNLLQNEETSSLFMNGIKFNI